MKFIELTTQDEDEDERISFNPCHIHFRENKKTGGCEILSSALPKPLKVKESFDYVKSQVELATYKPKPNRQGQNSIYDGGPMRSYVNGNF